jgi:MOSC domain-containing protein YiiM
MPHVLRLFRAPRRGWPMEELFLAEVAEDHGFVGCAHARPGGKRQVLLVDRETLEALALQPGMIRENITADGLNVNGLDVGASLQIGSALLQVTMPCTPCGHMENIRRGLRREIRGRRGVLCRVTRGGIICPCDSIERLAV